MGHCLLSDAQNSFLVSQVPAWGGGPPCDGDLKEWAPPACRYTFFLFLLPMYQLHAVLHQCGSQIQSAKSFHPCKDGTWVRKRAIWVTSACSQPAPALHPQALLSPSCSEQSLIRVKACLPGDTPPITQPTCSQFICSCFH